MLNTVELINRFKVYAVKSEKLNYVSKDNILLVKTKNCYNNLCFVLHFVWNSKNCLNLTDKLDYCWIRLMHLSESLDDVSSYKNVNLFVSHQVYISLFINIKPVLVLCLKNFILIAILFRLRGPCFFEFTRTGEGGRKTTQRHTVRGVLQRSVAPGEPLRYSGQIASQRNVKSIISILLYLIHS